MISADEIRQLNDLGLTAEQYRIVLSLIASSRDADDKRREGQRLRARKYRENKVSVTLQSHDASRDDCGKEIPPTPPKEIISNLLPFSKDQVGKEERSEIVALGDDWPRDFRERVWVIYPRKVGKAAAMRKLEHVRRSGIVKFVDLIAAIERYAASGLEVQFIKHLATWLNAGCWDDDPAAVNGAASHHGPRSTEEVHAMIRAEQERLANGKA